MYILLLLFLLVVAAVLMAYGLSHLNPNKMPDKANVLPKSDNTSKQQNEPAQQEQPTHFDLLDDNGDPIPSSDDRSRASASHPIDEPSVQNLRYFCIKDKGYHVSVWPKNQGYQGVDYIEFPIAGITHGEHIDDHLGEFVATLESDPANPYDAQAIKILASNGDHVGYVPKDTTSNVRNFTQLPCKCYCYIGRNNDMYFTDCYIKKESK